jgi:hypothetical protein
LKRCPECNSFFPDAEHYCELDGAVLVSGADAPSHPTSSRTLLPIGVLVGVLLGVLLSLVYFAMSRQPAEKNSNTTSASSSARQQEFLQPQQPAPVTTASSSPEPSVEPSPSPGVETPSPQNSVAQVELSPSSPISTASGANGKSNPVVITLDSGVTIEADDAWQTGEGIWYRKHGIVSLLDPKNVKTIKKVSPEPQPSPSASPSP